MQDFPNGGGSHQPSPPVTSQSHSNDIELNKIWAAFSYLGVISIVMYLLKKDSPFVLFHARQGMILFGAIIALTAVGYMTSVPYVGIMFFLISVIANIAIFVFAVIGFIEAIMGNYWKLPLAGDIAEKINF